MRPVLSEHNQSIERASKSGTDLPSSLLSLLSSRAAPSAPRRADPNKWTRSRTPEPTKDGQAGGRASGQTDGQDDDLEKTKRQGEQQARTSYMTELVSPVCLRREGQEGTKGTVGRPRPNSRTSEREREREREERASEFRRGSASVRVWSREPCCVVARAGQFTSPLERTPTAAMISCNSPVI